jgi:hypothetical protein
MRGGDLVDGVGHRDQLSFGAVALPFGITPSALSHATVAGQLCPSTSLRSVCRVILPTRCKDDDHHAGERVCRRRKGAFSATTGTHYFLEIDRALIPAGNNL